MPKQKPCKGLLSRVRVTKKGKVMSKACGSTHRRVVKTAKQRRQKRRIRALHPTAAKAVKALIGYK